MFGLRNRDTLPPDVAEELDALVTKLSAYLLAEHTENARHDQRPNGFDAVPIGTIAVWPLSIAPDSWLMCNGAAIRRDTYSQLFGVIGTTYGVGDGSTTYNLPNIAAGPVAGTHYMILSGVGASR